MNETTSIPDTPLINPTDHYMRWLKEQPDGDILINAIDWYSQGFSGDVEKALLNWVRAVVAIRYDHLRLVEIEGPPNPWAHRMKGVN